MDPRLKKQSAKRDQTRPPRNINGKMRALLKRQYAAMRSNATRRFFPVKYPRRLSEYARFARFFIYINIIIISKYLLYIHIFYIPEPHAPMGQIERFFIKKLDFFNTLRFEVNIMKYYYSIYQTILPPSPAESTTTEAKHTLLFYICYQKKNRIPATLPLSLIHI